MEPRDTSGGRQGRKSGRQKQATAKGDGRWRLRRGLRARHGQKRKRQGNWEIHRRLGLAVVADRVYGLNGQILRKINATVEVGPAGSTRSAGKPRTWGSGGA